MTFEQILARPEYDFMKTHPQLGNNVILLTYGGSYAYGTNHADSDIDLRGIATRSRSEILTGEDWEQVVERETDTTVYSLDKYMFLAQENNPNTIELLSPNAPYGFAVLTEPGKMLVDNNHMFLSRQVERTFGKYADTQLRRLMNKAARKLSQAELEAHILKSMRAQELIYNGRLNSEKEYIKLYLDEAVSEGLDREIFIDVKLEHLPLRKWPSMINDFANIVTTYDKMGQRNKKAIEHHKINKHMMHLVRLYLMAIDILEKEEIITYRQDDLPLLLSVLNGDYMDENSQPTPEFEELVNSMADRMAYAAKNTSLPLYPDAKRIRELKYALNAMVVDV